MPNQRARNRTAELDHLAPKAEKVVTRGKGAAFLAQAAADAAAGLLAYAEHPTALDAFEETLRRDRALRGVAAHKDLPPLAEVVDAIDAAAKPIELRQEDATAEVRRARDAGKRLDLQLARHNLAWAEARVLWRDPKADMAEVVEAWTPDLVVTIAGGFPDGFADGADILKVDRRNLLGRLADVILDFPFRHA